MWFGLVFFLPFQHFLESTHINATRPYLASGNWDYKINNPTTKQHDNIYCQSESICFRKRSLRKISAQRQQKKRSKKLGLKVFVVGELDLHENKLHNFEYISGTTPYTTTSSSSFASPTSPSPLYASEKMAIY